MNKARVQLTPGSMAELMYSKAWAPWGIPAPQPVIRSLVALGAVRGVVLDPGCGLGWNAVEYARAGCEVVGVDLAPTAVERARRNSRDAAVEVEFRVGDVTELDYEGQFDCVVDSKCFDNLATSDRLRYAKALHRAMKPGANLFMYGFGSGNINGFHNHETEEPDFHSVLPAAGFGITFVGSTTYVLLSRGYKPICEMCPQDVASGLLHVPVFEVHAVRRP